VTRRPRRHLRITRQAPSQEPPDDEEPASYGLVQLRGVPDGAEVDLDGRLWLRAQGLAQRWVALPEGKHTLTVRATGVTPVERRVDVFPGKQQVIRFEVRS